MSYRAIPVRSFRAEESLTPAQLEEKTTWDSFRDLSTTTKFGRVAVAMYSPVSPHTCLAVWANDMGAMMPLDTEELVFHQSSPHKYTTARYRVDGTLIVYSAGERGRVQVCTAKGESIKTFQHHRLAVRALAFTSDKIHVASFGDDRAVHVCSLGTGEIVFTAPNAHGDALLCGDAHPTDPHVVASASSDGVVKIWDTRDRSGAVEKFAVDGTAHSLRFAPYGGGDVLVCGTVGTVYVFDRRSSKPAYRVAPHAKAVVDLCFAKEGTRLLTASLDRTFCVLDTTDGYRTICRPAPQPCALTAIAMSPDGAELAIGREDGVLVRRIAGGVRDMDDEGGEQEARPQHWARPTALDTTGPARTKEAKYDYALRSFSYRTALLAALSEPKVGDEDVAYAVLEDLLQRNGLRVALGGWTEDETYRLFSYLIPNLRHRHRTALVVTVFEVVVEIYCEEIVKCERLMTVVRALREDMEAHLGNLYEMETVAAALDVIMEPTTISP